MRTRRRNWRLRNFLSTPATVALCGAVAIAALGNTPSPRQALFVWNATASAPVGLYRVTHGRALSRGDLVLAVPTPALAAFADARGYLPMRVPLVKRIAAVAGDDVCARGNAIFIDGRFAAARLAADREGRPLPSWSGCRTLRSGDVFLLMPDARASFDGRYFGPTTISDIAGTLEPLWTY
ncbi:MAG TPA: S26 family signal peptidase [Rhizomicrobium sp.]|nr:S26 family signal peptidase [Rhizomicrobium sp.]